jgi:hypothetical protein
LDTNWHPAKGNKTHRFMGRCDVNGLKWIEYIFIYISLSLSIYLFIHSFIYLYTSIYITHKTYTIYNWWFKWW